ncbi:MAG: nucleotidyltransferase domain-containing protein [Chloroflexota bacterium]
MRAKPIRQSKEQRVAYATRPPKSRTPRPVLFPQARYLTRKERVALKAYQDYLLARLPDQIERIVLFGSKARGDSRRDSDVDLLVVLGGEKPKTAWGLDEPRWFTIVDCTFDFLMQYDVYIAPTVMHSEEMRDEVPLIADIRKEGTELWRHRAIRKRN